MTKLITVGYDGSAPSSEAVMWAATEAKVRSARLRIVSCFDYPIGADAVSGSVATEGYASLLERSRSVLVHMRDIVAEEHPGVDVDIEASAGPASLALVDNVDPDDLIVVGASSHKGAAAFWLGSTPRYIVRHGPCPVVVVRGAASRGRPDRVVVGVDGSTLSQHALRWAGDEADRHGVDLLVVHAWLYPYLAVDASSSQARDLTNIDAACLLERAVENAREEFSAEVTGTLVESGPTTALLETIRDCDLLVVGSHGRGALSSRFGSTVNSLMDQCSVPLVVVRDAEPKD